MPSESEVAIRLENVGVTYRTSFEKRPTLKSAVMRMGHSQRQVRHIEALKGINLELRSGNVLGIVGNNGAGKTSLIRAISGILPPSTGRIEVRGRVNTLLALGLGFNDKMSGYDNVILGGLALGYTRDEIVERSGQIGAWTELGDRLEMPVSTYSTGMRARLGFSVAVHLDPDILIVDEALSTGDAKFKAKAMASMRGMLEQARTMVFVSHALATVQRLCTDAIWLEDGRLKMHDTPKEVLAAYTAANNVDPNAVTTRQDF